MELPMETVMKLPVQDRRYFIQRHNAEQKGKNEEQKKHNKQAGRTYTGEALNEFAKREQDNLKNV